MNYNGYTISIEILHDACNPLDEVDVPLVVHYDDQIVEHGLYLKVPYLTQQEIQDNLEDIKWQLRCPDFVAHVMAHRLQGGDVEDFVAGKIDEYVKTLPTGEFMHLLVSAYAWKGIAAKTYRYQHYYLLAVATPEWAERTGCPPEYHQQEMDRAAALYRWWIDSEVYGFVIKAPDGREVDSCWGFYGPPEESGLITTAKHIIDEEINNEPAN